MGWCRVAQIAVWLKHLIAMVVLAGFLELVLPDNQLKNVAKLILGLVIMLFLLQPLSNFYQLPATLAEAVSKTVFRATTTSPTNQVIRKGLLLRRQWQRDFDQAAHQGLEAKLQKIFTLLEGAVLQRVTCRYEGTRLRQVKLLVVEPAKNNDTRLYLKRQIIRSVQLVTELPADQIEIVWGEHNAGSLGTGFENDAP
jgi:stage III sporulation protein AF